jgi:LytS/YehU family sensor histidine kinase
LVSRVEVQPETAQLRLPGFLLHPLVENAVKYGMQTSPMPLHVRIRSALQNGELILEVANSGNWMETHLDSHKESESVGLRLVNQQLTHAFPGKYRFCRVSQDGWVVQRIGIAGLA